MLPTFQPDEDAPGLPPPGHPPPGPPPPSPPPPSPPPPGPPPQWESVLQHPSRHQVLQASLVLDAVDIEQRIHRLDAHWHLLVRPDRATEARRQLTSWQIENARVSRPPSPGLHGSGLGWVGSAAFLGVIWMLPWLEGLQGFDQLREVGALHAEAVRNGAWWQAVTALTLHADLAHIAANSLFGALFGYLLARFLGAGMGWLLAVVSAVAANLTNAYIQPDEFRSLGASTAVFAALGVIGAYAWQRRYFASDDRRRRFAPAFAAIALIAFTGTSGERVDLFGHLFGFLYGFLTGYLYARFSPPQIGISGQWRAGIAVLALGILSWMATG